MANSLPAAPTGKRRGGSARVQLRSRRAFCTCPSQIPSRPGAASQSSRRRRAVRAVRGLSSSVPVRAAQRRRRRRSAKGRHQRAHIEPLPRARTFAAGGGCVAADATAHHPTPHTHRVVQASAGPDSVFCAPGPQVAQLTKECLLGACRGPHHPWTCIIDTPPPPLPPLSLTRTCVLCTSSLSPRA